MATEHDLELASIESQLAQRSENSCELCGATDSLAPYAVTPVKEVDLDHSAHLCSTCIAQVDETTDLDEKHLLCLNESAWSTVPAIQALALRLLTKLSHTSWASDLADQLYIEDDVRSWAEDGMNATTVITVDSNNVVLQKGDTVTVIKDLDVKGANFTAKRGTIVKGIHLVGDGKLVEGKVNGTSIYLIASFLKKS